MCEVGAVLQAGFCSIPASISGESPGPSRGRAYQPVGRTPHGTIWLARTGGLPGRSLRLSPRDAAGGLLPHPFTHHLCHGEPRPSAGLLSVALDVTEGLRSSVPRVTLARAASATSPDFALHPGLEPEDAATGRTARTAVLYLTSRGRIF